MTALDKLVLYRLQTLDFVLRLFIILLFQYIFFPRMASEGEKGKEAQKELERRKSLPIPLTPVTKKRKLRKKNI